MLIVPELRKVFILVPRTGSGTLYREMKRVYPQSMLLYRHMEADGCPRGYDRWEKVGFVRHPLMRLWSLYHYLRNWQGSAGGNYGPEVKRLHDQAGVPFAKWICENSESFTTPWDASGGGAYWPVLSRINPAPENKLSQRDYLRPDLGTTIYKFEILRERMLAWGLNPTFTINHTDHGKPHVTAAILNHLERHQRWDMEQGCEFI